MTVGDGGNGRVVHSRPQSQTQTAQPGARRWGSQGEGKPLACGRWELDWEMLCPQGHSAPPPPLLPSLGLPTLTEMEQGSLLLPFQLRGAESKARGAQLMASPWVWARPASGLPGRRLSRGLGMSLTRTRKLLVVFLPRA